MKTATGPQIHVHVLLDGKTVIKKTFDSFPILFGRGFQNHIHLPFEFISRQHGTILLEGNKIAINDLGSSNGILVNGEPINSCVIGASGRFTIHSMIFDLELELPAQQNAPAPTSTPPELPPFERRKQSRTITRQMAENSKPAAPAISPAQQFKEALPVVPKAPSTVPSKPSMPSSGGLEIVRERPKGLPVWESLFQVALDQEIPLAPRKEIGVQMLISWQGDLYDIHSYLYGDALVISPSFNADISLPSLKNDIRLGRVSSKGAEITLSQAYHWSLEKEGQPVSLETLKENKRIIHSMSFILEHNEIYSIDLGNQLKVHVRYIRKQRPFIPRTWIENQEEFKKAIGISMLAHLAFSILALLSVPKSDAPLVKNIPERFARLLVEPPKQAIVEPTPTPPMAVPIPEEMKPKPPPQKVAEKPKPKPKPKRLVEKPKPKPVPSKIAQKIPTPMPKVAINKKVVPEQQKPIPEKKVAPQPNPRDLEIAREKAQAAKEIAREKAAADAAAAHEKAVADAAAAREKALAAAAEAKAAKEAAAVANLMSALPGSSATGNLPTNVKVSKNAPTTSGPGYKVSQVMGQVQGKANSGGTGIAGSPGRSLASAGGVGFAQTNGGKAGKRKVGGIVPEAPTFQGSEQGLSHDKVMKVVNAHLGEIQSCYERALMENPSLVGRIEYEWTINPKGSVDESSVKRSEMGNADFLNQCVLRVIQGMKFPEAKNKLPTVASIGFPFGRH